MRRDRAPCGSLASAHARTNAQGLQPKLTDRLGTPPDADDLVGLIDDARSFVRR
jgi:hypothetical protein